MNLLIILTSFLFFQTPKSLKEKPGIYCNARFGYCIEYPEFLIPQRESTNGDGKVFSDKKKQKILTVFGRLNQDADGNTISLKKQYNSDLEELLSLKSKISYKKIGNNFYILSGHKNGKIFYRKTLIKEDAFCFAFLEYQESEKAIYDSVSVSIFESFR